MPNEINGRPVVSNPFAPDVFADHAISFEHVQGTVRISLAVLKPQEGAPPSGLQYVSVGRVVMSDIGAQRLCLALYDYLKKEGMDPAKLVTRGNTSQ